MAEYLIPKNEQGKDMSPIETRTGVALSLWAPGDGKTNRHHSHFYKRYWMNGPRKIETRAVRISRLQRVQMEFHNGTPKAFHKYFDGTAFPRDEKQSFGIAILNCAKYIAPFVVDMTSGAPEIVETTPHMRRVLHRPGVLTVERGRRTQRCIGQFLMQQATKQNFSHVKESQLEQFLELGKTKYLTNEEAQEKRYEIGIRLANIGLGAAVNGIDKTYLQARNQLAVPESAPVCAWQVAKGYVAGFESDYFGDIEQNLQSHFDNAA